jgi:site-specific DNA-methyltransferase (adenine-specific)
VRKKDWHDEYVHLYQGDSLSFYPIWPAPSVIISDGGYGILGFEGDTSNHLGLPDWYEPHIRLWSRYATPKTNLWFWNSEIGWASVHPILEKYGWRYVNCNVWNKGKAHIAGNVNTNRIRRFPVVTELCVHYAFESKIDGLHLREWIRKEWQRTGLPVSKANEACGVKDAAVRKYLDRGHLWYFPPPEMFSRMVEYANRYGRDGGKPYFSKDGVNPLSPHEWKDMRYVFHCPHGYTNVWDRNPLQGSERIKGPVRGTKAAHLNQKPLDLMRLIIESSSDEGDVIWEPFGGLFSACLAAKLLKRRAYAAEVDSAYFSLGVERFRQFSLF